MLQIDALVTEEEVTIEAGAVEVTGVVTTSDIIADRVAVLKQQRKRRVTKIETTKKVMNDQEGNTVVVEEVAVEEVIVVVAEATDADNAANQEMITHRKMKTVIAEIESLRMMEEMIEVMIDDPGGSANAQDVHLHKVQVMREMIDTVEMIDIDAMIGSVMMTEEMIVIEEEILAGEAVEVAVIVATTTEIAVTIVVMIEIAVTTVMMEIDANDQGDSDVLDVTRGRAREKKEVNLKESTMLATEDKNRSDQSSHRLLSYYCYSLLLTKDLSKLFSPIYS